MGELRIGQVVSLTPAAAETRRPDDPARLHDAAKQFEALLIGQILRETRESGGGWLGSGGDSSGDCVTEFAEQHVAAALAEGGGLGLSDLILSGLKPGR